MPKRLKKSERKRTIAPDVRGDLPIITTDTSSDATADELQILDAMDQAKMPTPAKKSGTGTRTGRKAT